MFRHIITILIPLVPNFTKPVWRLLLYRVVLPLHHWWKTRMVSRDKIHQYFMEPSRPQDLPQEYLKEAYTERSQLLVRIMERYTTRNAKILEIGCNVGRNLNFLYLAGFKNLTGIEISEKAVELLRQSYPGMAQNTKIYTAPVEDIIRQFRNCEFDVVFAMAVLEHIHKKSEWVYSEIVRITKDLLITLEDEDVRAFHKKPRNYGHIFEHLGMKQIKEIGMNEKFEGLWCGMTTRIFQSAKPFLRSASGSRVK